MTELLADRTTRFSHESALPWPRKVEVLGVRVSATTYDEATSVILQAARERHGGAVTCHPVHGLIAARCDSQLRRSVNQFEMITPDGQPVRWAMNLLHKTRLRERVYGPELMIRLCRGAAEAGVSVYLFGSTPEVLGKLEVQLQTKFPSLEIAGVESPPFRELTDEEDRALVERINASGAGLMFVGLGSPKQDVFAAEHRARINAVQVCVGAAFDFHAGTLRMAPPWMQRYGLEWLFRLCMEPRRLWRRYLVANSTFVATLLADFVFRRISEKDVPRESAT